MSKEKLYRSLLSVEVRPRELQTEQCYWHIGHGAAGGSWTYGQFNKKGGAVSGPGSNYERSFRGTFRFKEGVLVSYQANYIW